jgi:hypothetical protein
MKDQHNLELQVQNWRGGSAYIASRTLAVLDERLRNVVGEFQERFADRLPKRCP